MTRAFVATEGRTGLSIGVVRAKTEPKLENGKREWKPKVEIPEVVELPILTHLPLSGPNGKDTKSRNHINVLTSAGVIVLPGKDGTRTELELALEYGRPTLLYLGKHAVDGQSAADLLKKHGSELLTVATDASQHDSHRSSGTLYPKGFRVKCFLEVIGVLEVVGRSFPVRPSQA